MEAEANGKSLGSIFISMAIEAKKLPRPPDHSLSLLPKPALCS